MVTYTSEEEVEIPHLDLLTFLFESGHTLAEEETELHVEADNPANKVSKSQARQLIKRIAWGLRRRYGIGAERLGEDVVICTSNGNPFVPILFFGVIAAGGIFSSASTAFTTEELVRQIKTASANVLVCTNDQKEKTARAAEKCGIPLSRVLILDYSNPQSWALTPVGRDRSNIIGDPSEMIEWRRISNLRQLQDTVVCLLFSSGTTGVPKGVMLTHRNLVASMILSLHPASHYLRKRRSEGNPFRFRTVGHLPVAHIAGIQQYFLNSHYLGGTTYWLPKYDFGVFLAANRRFKTTYLFSVPPIWLQIAKSDKVTDHFDSVEVGLGGAAPMSGDLQRSASAKLGRGEAWVGQTWGLTETTGSVTVSKWDERDETGSVSSLEPNLTLEIKDDEGHDVANGQAGELVVGGPLVAKGYYNNKAATEAAFENGRFWTGDIGVMRNGRVYIVDRKKELIKYKGLQVAPAELEALLMSDRRILDAAVIGVAYDATEAPRAYVVKKDESLTEDNVRDVVRENLASHKQLRGGVVFITEVPKSASGKILRKELRQLVQREASVGRSKL